MLFHDLLEGSEIVIDLSNMDPGMYFIEISNDKLGISTIEKIIKYSN